MVFMNFYIFVTNYATNKIDQSFAKCSYFILLKLKRLLQLELINYKLVGIIVRIFLVVVLFWELLLAQCNCHIVKLTL